MVAEMERRFVRLRQQALIEGAKPAGVYRGHKFSVPVLKVRAGHNVAHGPSAIAKALEIDGIPVF